MTELYKNDQSQYFLTEIPYREALMMREARVSRLKKEREEAEKERQAEMERQKREATRNAILRK